jgi:hypothetical protein
MTVGDSHCGAGATVTNEVVASWVGFAGQKHEEGERRPSTKWPIQRFQ